MHNALRMLVDWVNTVRGGIRISTNGNGTVKRPLQIITVDDGSLDASIAPITKGLIDGSLLGPMTAACGESSAGVDFILGPYSSGLTELAAKVTNAQGKLLMAAGASATSVFVNRSQAFGMLPPANTYMHAGIELLRARHVRTIALIFEDAAATKDWCKGAADKAKQLNITVVASVQVSQQLNRTEVASALAVFQAALPDAVVGCTYYDVCAEFLTQANLTKFYTQTSLFTVCVTDPKFGKELAATAAYVLGVTPWSEYDTDRDQMMGWSPADFAQKYTERFQQLPPYQAVAAFAGGLLLTAAIEECGCLDVTVVAQKLSQIRKRTVYGDTTFSVNRQNLLQFVTVQHNRDLVPSKVNASTIIFPTPSWERRDCEVGGLCKTRGGCQDNGDCVFANCKAGQYLKESSDGSGGQSCVDCPAGFISTSGLVTQCTACMPGVHTPLAPAPALLLVRCMRD
jgi:branched-chain amino acid transport system substrate-binding protein